MLYCLYGIRKLAQQDTIPQDTSLRTHPSEIVAQWTLNRLTVTRSESPDQIITRPNHFAVLITPIFYKYMCRTPRNVN